MNPHIPMIGAAFPLLAYLRPESPGTPGDFVWSAVLWVLLFLAPVVVVASLVFHWFSAPLRRRERTRIFLDLMEAGFRQGQRPEAALARAAQTHDPVLGKNFQKLAALLQRGARLGLALEQVPELLPAQAVALIRVGEEVGDVRKVLPACRGLLRDAESQTRNGFNYLVISSLVLMPTLPAIILVLINVVFPRFIEITQIYNEPTPAATLLIMRIGSWVAAAQLCLAFCLWCWVWFYVRGPRAYGAVRVDGQEAPRHHIFRTPLWNFIGRPLAPLRDRLLFALPWRRRRLQRDFCATLSILLDSETPEPAALTLAAEATANQVFVTRARKALDDLRAGKTLQLALQRFDSAGEFAWRLANAAAQQAGFVRALAGWIEALDAKAFQQEQTASQLVTTGLVLFNGLVTGLIAVGVFTVLISLESQF